VDDYGHHPTEIRTTLKAMRERYSPARLIAVYQPHQASRMRLLMDDFAAAFDRADEVIVPDIYFVRDSAADKEHTSSKMLVDRLVARGVNARYMPQFPAVVQYLKANIHSGDVVLTIGAGPVWQIGRDLVQGVAAVTGGAARAVVGAD
jgi:UDP-N-acetylmuramate--alanine ligase